MQFFVGIDVSLDSSSICVIDERGVIIKEGKTDSDPAAIARFIRRGPELQRAVAVRSRVVRTMDEHFADLFARYEQLAPRHSVLPAALRDAARERPVELPFTRPAVLGS